MNILKIKTFSNTDWPTNLNRDQRYLGRQGSLGDVSFSRGKRLNISCCVRVLCGTDPACDSASEAETHRDDKQCQKSRVYIIFDENKWRTSKVEGNTLKSHAFSWTGKNIHYNVFFSNYCQSWGYGINYPEMSVCFPLKSVHLTSQFIHKKKTFTKHLQNL